METISQVNTPHSFIDIDTKPDYQDFNVDLMAATSSSESRTSPHITGSDIQFSSENKMLSDMKDILGMEGSSLDILKEVNELDVENVDDAVSNVNDGTKEEAIDPDDDMAGIMMELQKDKAKLESS